MEVATVAWSNVYVPISAQVAAILRRFAENQYAVQRERWRGESL